MHHEVRLSAVNAPAALWKQAADQVHAWLAAGGLPARDVMVLLPYAPLLAPARGAFATRAGWQPRIETPHTLASVLAPAAPAAPGRLSFDWVLDALAAGALLRSRPFGADWARRDRAGFDAAVAAFVDAAQALARAAHALAPNRRPAWWGAVREQTRAAGGPAALEASLLALAVEWAAECPAPATDALFTLRPAAWVLLRAGGPDPLSEQVLDVFGGPTLRIDTDPPPDAPFAEMARQPAAPRLIECTGAEQEARAAADAVLQALQAGRAPVALIALDRLLVRRVRALLERCGVPLQDETGWRLSTTRAAVRPMALLRAALPTAGADARLEWLKGWPPARATPHALQVLESVWREDGRRWPADAKTAADALWARAQTLLRGLLQPSVRSLHDWLGALRQGLATELDALAADAAGAPVLRTLRLDGPDDAAWQQATRATPLDLDGFVAWVDSALEQGAFVPPVDALAPVVLTPLSRAVLRPFGAVVLPGADDVRLGVPQAPPGLISDALAGSLSLETRAERLQRQRAALAQLLRVPDVVLLRRLADAGEPMSPSPDVQWLDLERERAGQPALARVAWQPLLRQQPISPMHRPAPSAAADLPATLSASALEALRDCPYRFFARSVLRLGEVPELAAPLDKRDYGNWLHAVLDRFHRDRQPVQGVPPDSADDAARLAAVAHVMTAELRLDAADLLPFRASFDAFVPAYLAWLAPREAAGWFWQEGETEYRLEPGQATRPLLRGRVDRIDQGPGGARELLDYKTGSAAPLKKRVKDPLEDTQLAFYAALLSPEAVGAAYLTLDGRESPELLVHPDSHLTAQVLLSGLADEWARVQAGAGLPALGEAPVCDYCEARGLCRRDHWSAA